jgi:hypothetical protein
VQIDGAFQKAPSSSVIPLGTQQKVDRVAIAIDSSVQVLPLAGDLEWSERPGVVELFPGLSSPNRTCTSQRIRLSIQVLLKAKATSTISLKSRSNLRSLFSVDHVASLLCISPIIKGVHLIAVG